MGLFLVAKYHGLLAYDNKSTIGIIQDQKEVLYRRVYIFGLNFFLDMIQSVLLALLCVLTPYNLYYTLPSVYRYCLYLSFVSVFLSVSSLLLSKLCQHDTTFHLCFFSLSTPHSPTYLPLLKPSSPSPSFGPNRSSFSFLLYSSRIGNNSP